MSDVPVLLEPSGLRGSLLLSAGLTVVLLLVTGIINLNYASLEKSHPAAFQRSR